MTRLKKDRMYVVEWRDHYSTAGWQSKSDTLLSKDFILKTVGFYVTKSKRYIHLAMTDGEQAYSNIMSILRNNIISITRIGEE